MIYSHLGGDHDPSTHTVDMVPGDDMRIEDARDLMLRIERGRKPPA